MVNSEGGGNVLIDLTSLTLHSTSFLTIKVPVGVVTGLVVVVVAPSFSLTHDALSPGWVHIVF